MSGARRLFHTGAVEAQTARKPATSAAEISANATPFWEECLAAGALLALSLALLFGVLNLA